MSVSLFIAQIIGPFYLLAGVGMLLNLEFSKRMYGEFLKNEGLFYLGGVLALLIGLIILRLQSAWTMHWIVCVFGWISFLKGLAMTVFPTWSLGVVRKWKVEKHLKEWSYVALALGVVFSYFGYVA